MKKYIIVRNKTILPDSIYHVIQRAPGDELLFKSDRDKMIFLTLIQKVIPKFQLKLISFSLMPNHIHLQIKTKKPNLSIGMKSLFERYAKIFNFRHKRKGHVFHGVYRAVYCDSNFSALIVSIYIHLNAYKAKIVKDPFSYKWHSLNEFVNNGTQNITDNSIILNLLNKDINRAKSLYKKMIINLSLSKNYNISDNKEAIWNFYKDCSKSMKLSEFI